MRVAVIAEWTARAQLLEAERRPQWRNRVGRWIDMPDVTPLVALAGRSVDMEGDWGKNPAIHDVAQRQIGELLARFPIPFKAIQVREGVNEFNQYAGKSKDRIYVSQSFLDDADAAKRAREFKGITVHGGDRAGTIVHEFGHVLDGYLLTEHTDWYRKVLEPWLNEPITYEVNGKSVTAPRWSAGKPSEVVSAYGGESKAEYVAEAFTDWWLHGEKAHPRSQELGRMFQGQLGRSTPRVKPVAPRKRGGR